MTQLVMVIRHAEKPSDDGAIKGVSPSGDEDRHDLAVRGWQRAGALVRFFAPRPGVPFADPRIATPKTIFATAVNATEHSLRPQRTVEPLADLIRIDVDTSLGKDQLDQLKVAAITAAANGPTLICWHHDRIADLVDLFEKIRPSPRAWDKDRFDLVWMLRRAGAAGPWDFDQVPQLLLHGDSNNPII